MKYLLPLCSCLLGATFGGAIYPPEEAAEQMQAGSADAGLEMWRILETQENMFIHDHWSINQAVL